MKYFIFFILFPIHIYSQRGENVSIQAVYKVQSASNEKKIINDSCLLSTSPTYSYFYSLGKIKAAQDAEKEFLTTNAINGNYNCTNCFPFIFYKSYSENKIYRIEQLMGELFAYNPPTGVNVSWVLQNDTLKINDILCLKAIGKCDSTVYTVYYAPNIPVSDGPSILQGLPGLILKSESSTGLKIELLSLNYMNGEKLENKLNNNFQFTTYSQFQIAKKQFLDDLKSGNPVQLSNGITIQRKSDN
jgi:GLPGLI family protein